MNFELNLNESQDFVLESRDVVGFEVGSAESSSFEISSITVAVPNKGDKGDTGEKGKRGERGEQGVRGEKGETGERGPVGPQGLTGPMGPVGPQGVQGAKGDRGDIGPVGPRGEVGPQGPVGPKGDKGDPGSVDNVDYNNLLNKPDLSVYETIAGGNGKYAPKTHTHAYSALTGRPAAMSTAEANAGTANYDRFMRASVLKGAIQTHQTQPDWNANSGKGAILNKPNIEQVKFEMKQYVDSKVLEIMNILEGVIGK